ncbi:MAG: GGDEF domain-containing protein [Gammaproteobacteria bacterium]|nr:MAG: GGDEF domain-containing protein [Gammaproteobacteria bacterium]UCH38665.1 MAG: GGDEF domain-containing protein [Gammaproteobacteria bacterium]
MKVFKSLLPILVLMVVAFYGYQKYNQLPPSATIGITYLTHMLALIVAGLSIRFSRSSVFFYVLLIVATNVILRAGWADGEFTYGLLSTFLPLLLVVLTLLPDRGIFSIKAIPAYAVIVLTCVFWVIVVATQPAWALQAVLSDWLPPQYFDWTGQSQSVLIVSFASLYIMLTLSILNPSLHLCAGFGVLVMLVLQLHFGDQGRSLNVFGGTGLLMCLYAIMQETWRMAYIDELTGLPGRRALREKFQKIGSKYTVAMLDVDHFKKFNDTFGHDAGDAVLRMIASKMTRVSGGGLPYRYGGEEFCIVFTGKNSQEAVRHLDALREAIASKPFIIRRVGRRDSDNRTKTSVNNSIKITVSIGFADSSKDESTPWNVLKRADQALYRAKGKGRNCVSE